MKLLLDTHIWLWGLQEPQNLSRRVASAIENPANELWLSPMSIWELVMLVEKRRVTLNTATETWVAQAMSRAPVREAPITYEVALETRQVRLPHRDPVDHLLVATARVFELTLVTADQRLIGAKGLSVLPSR